MDLIADYTLQAWRFVYTVSATVESGCETSEAGAGYFLFMHPSSADDPQRVLNRKGGTKFFHLNGKCRLNLAQAKGKNPSWHSGSGRCPFASC